MPLTLSALCPSMLTPKVFSSWNEGSCPPAAGLEWAEQGDAQIVGPFASPTTATLSLDDGNSVKIERADL